VRWFDIDNPEPADASNSSAERVFTQGFDRGGAKFNRLEGCWWDDGSVFFVSTSGGDAKNGDVNSDGFAEGCGQIWEYRAHGKVGRPAPADLRIDCGYVGLSAPAGVFTPERVVGLGRAG